MQERGNFNLGLWFTTEPAALENHATVYQKKFNIELPHYLELSLWGHSQKKKKKTQSKTLKI